MEDRERRVAPASRFARGRVAVGVAVLAVSLGVARWQWNQSHPHWPHSLPRYAPSLARLRFEAGLDTLGQALERLATSRDSSGHDRERALGSARSAYKRVECLVTVLSPTLSALLNGPLLEDEDRPPPPLGAPAGFQVVEAALSGDPDRPSRDSVRRTVEAMHAGLRDFRDATRFVHVEDAVLLDAFRLELARVVTLGLAGFDTDRHPTLEAVAAFEGMQSLAEAATADRAGDELQLAWGALDSALARAAGYLRAHPDFDSLDRLAFIVGYANPASRAVATVRNHLPDARPPLRRLWRATAATVFEPDAFDPAAYAPSFAPPPSAPLVALGRRLFNEPALSGPATRSCATCHNPTRAFTDGRARPVVLAHAMVAPRHTPTLLNAAYQPVLFDDGRAGSLEAQAEAVLASPAEMGGSEAVAARRLAQDTSYRAAFARVFDAPDQRPTGRRVRVALAAYVRSLSALDSRFDRAVAGDPDALSASEQRGFTVFMGKGRCGVCHFAPLFNGTMPPDFATSEPEIIGVPSRADLRYPRLDADPGRAGYDHVPEHRGAFRVPTLRNIALTAPYMHNGVFTTLDQVVDFYDHGGGAGLGLAVGQTLARRRLRMTPGEKRDLVAFLGALTDTTLQPRPLAGAAR